MTERTAMDEVMEQMPRLLYLICAYHGPTFSVQAVRNMIRDYEAKLDAEHGTTWREEKTDD